MNESRDQFLVEQEGQGWDDNYCWWCPKCEVYLDGHQVTFGEIHQTCETSVILKDANPDFSKWENMGRLLELAKMHSLVYEISNFSVEIIKFEGKMEERSYQKTVYEVSDIPNIAATLIAQALGFKEVRK